jgi:prophage regulatory protein
LFRLIFYSSKLLTSDPLQFLIERAKPAIYAEHLGLFVKGKNMAEHLQKFLRLKQVKTLTGLSRSSIYDAIKNGDFPSSISIGARSVAWTEASIAHWQASKIEHSRKTVANKGNNYDL